MGAMVFDMGRHSATKQPHDLFPTPSARPKLSEAISGGLMLFTAQSGKEEKVLETLTIDTFIKYVLEDMEKHRGDISPLRDFKVGLLDTITDQVFCGTKPGDSNNAGIHNRQTSGALTDLLPRGYFDPSLDHEEQSYIAVSDLNLYTLNTLAAVDVHWTKNLARHLLISKSHGRTKVEIFSLPSALLTAFPRAMSGSLVEEVASSSVRLFNIDQDVIGCIIISNTMQPHNSVILSSHRSIAEGMILRSLWCWCRTSR
ncbi:hypothetical protein P154DRAFT_540476 [Amniculicola lignicola CBS 123094]|uniref:Uncharacterized protein n=1 Tax=Amniculicola lignicola CBS 123094 TaxID=1392246 RepID=A0A6A5W6T4_9PLEO|nr:hypothetical protein P154DRAFT_540476 [Amniculicola lignicola CBS 123094]